MAIDGKASRYPALGPLHCGLCFEGVIHLLARTLPQHDGTKRSRGDDYVQVQRDVLEIEKIIRKFFDLFILAMRIAL